MNYSAGFEGAVLVAESFASPGPAVRVYVTGLSTEDVADTLVLPMGLDGCDIYLKFRPGAHDEDLDLLGKMVERLRRGR